MTDLTVRPAVDVADVPALVAWLATNPPPDEVLATREETMRRAAYLRGRDEASVVACLKAARLTEWEMARRWPPGDRSRRDDDRPLLDASNTGNREAWSRVYAVGAQSQDWILSRIEPEDLTQAAIIRGPSTSTRVVNNSGEPEWYTPPDILDAARAVMGAIDLDPASSAVAQRTVRAGAYFTAEDDGLAQPWHGRVWLNPPYAQPLVGQFIDKVLAEHRAGRVSEAVVLVNNSTETSAGQSLLSAAAAVCFPRGRVRFLTPDGTPAATPLQGQMVAYLTAGDTSAFRREFGRLGAVL